MVFVFFIFIFGLVIIVFLGRVVGVGMGSVGIVGRVGMGNGVVGVDLIRV